MPPETPVAVTEHTPEERAQVDEEKVTEPPFRLAWLKVTVPVGDEPVTVAVQVE